MGEYSRVLPLITLSTQRAAAARYPVTLPVCGLYVGQVMCASRKPGGGGGSGTPGDSGSTWLARGRPRVGAHLAGSVPGVDPHTLTAPGGAALTSFVGDWCLCTVLVSVDRRTAHAVSRCVSLHRAQGATVSSRAGTVALKLMTEEDT